MELCTCTSSCCSSCISMCGWGKKEKSKGKNYACYCFECKKKNNGKIDEFKIVLQNNVGKEKDEEEERSRSQSKSKTRKFVIVKNAGTLRRKEEKEKSRSKSERRNDDCEKIVLCKPKSLTVIINKEKLKKRYDAKVSKVVSEQKLSRKKSRQKYYLQACDSDSNDSVLFKPRSEKHRTKLKKNDDELRYSNSSAYTTKQKARSKKPIPTAEDSCFLSSSTSLTSSESGCTRWCRNRNLTNDIRHDRNIEFQYPFKSDPCPKNPVFVEDMKKLKCFLKVRNLRERQDFDVIPGIGEIYCKRLTKRLNNVYELLETAHVMDKTNFKSLLKCYANVNCYFGEMAYQSLIEYAKHYRLNF